MVRNYNYRFLQDFIKVENDDDDDDYHYHYYEDPIENCHSILLILFPVLYTG